jgi:hypothetical protein
MTTETQAGATRAPATNGALLRLRGISKRFGAVEALSAVDLEVHAGYDFAAPAPDVMPLLDAIQEDRTGIFWG